MLGNVWINLLEKVPSTYKDQLLLVTSTGMEISLQEVLRTEERYLVLRGRQAGTNDTGRVFFIPYEQINFMCIQQVLTGLEVAAMYADPSNEKVDPASTAAEVPAPPPVEENVEETPPPEPPPIVEEPSRPAGPPRLSKSELLARIRSRQGASDLADR